MKNRYSRTRLWVDPPFQLRLLLRTAFYLLLYGLMVFHIGFTFHRILAVGRGAEQSLASLYGEYLRQQMGLVYAFVVVAPIILYDLLKFSHRVAGPLSRCRTLMDDMADGKPVAEFRPRKDDLMNNFFDSFNRLIRVWNERRGAESEVAPTTRPSESISESIPLHR